MSTELLEVRELKTHYRTRLKENVYAVDDVSFSLDDGKVLGIAGESGCGKSTLAQSLMGLFLPPLYFGSGSIILNGTDIITLNKEQLRKQVLGSEIAYIPQAAMNALNPTRKIISFIEDVMAEHRLAMSKKEVRQMAEERFASLNLSPNVLDSYPNELSGGMKQRTVIAVSTILNPKVLVADEPTSALDVTSQKLVIKLLKDLMDKRFISSIIFITHELPLLYHISDDIMIMYAGQIVEKAMARQIIFEPIHPYTKRLMGSIILPEAGMKRHKLEAIPGVPPNLKSPPPGCRFAERCLYTREECKKDLIENIKSGDREYRCILVNAQGVVGK